MLMIKIFIYLFIIIIINFFAVPLRSTPMECEMNNTGVISGQILLLTAPSLNNSLFLPGNLYEIFLCKLFKSD